MGRQSEEMMFNTQQNKNTEQTAIGAALEGAGFVDETPKKAAERIWKKTKCDPVETMRLFDEWARETPERMAAVLGSLWEFRVRAFLQKSPKQNGWRYGGRFSTAMKKVQKDVDKNSKSSAAVRQQRLRFRKKNKITIVRAEINTKSGVITLLNKEFEPFKHIRINGLHIAEITTMQALRYCDNKTTDVKFIRELCQMIPDPRKPIGEQWTAEMVKKAKQANM